MNDPVVAVALSGGVDSLVTGFLLKKQYKQVFGIHFTTGYESRPVLTHRLEKQLGFKVFSIDLSREFEEQVIQYFVATYFDGRTPNPCVICNRTIKFGVLMDQARARGADLLATGHYATLVNEENASSGTDIYLKKGSDPKKDQSYFLSMLSRDQLRRIVFPLSRLTKEKVRETARQNSLFPLFPSESQDICFIQDNDFSGFIRRKRPAPPVHGDIVDLSGKIVGRHKGLHRYTVGQRRGLNCPAAEPYYVRRLDLKTNRLVVCFKRDLMQSEFTVKQINWNYSRYRTIDQVTTKIRYSHPGAAATLVFENDVARVIFEKPQRAVTPGQVAAFYKGDRVLGAGIIQ